MQSNLSATEWRTLRLKNYGEKLQLSRTKALRRLMLFTDIEKLTKEFDRIVDSKFWSSNEPGLSHEERKRRLKAMHKQPEPEPIQLSLFFNNKSNQNGNDSKSHRLQKRFPYLFRRGIEAA
jgi:hypothetical protein